MFIKLDQTPRNVTVIRGPRQSGKTTQLIKHINDHASDENTFCVIVSPYMKHSLSIIKQSGPFAYKPIALSSHSFFYKNMLLGWGKSIISKVIVFIDDKDYLSNNEFLEFCVDHAQHIYYTELG